MTPPEVKKTGKHKYSKVEKIMIVFGVLSFVVPLWFIFVQPIYATKPIHKAAKQGDLTAIKKLVEHGTPIDLQGPQFDTPLTIALANNQTEVARYLVSKGANVTGQLLRAVGTKDVELVRMMIIRGAKAQPMDLATAASLGYIRGRGNDADLVDCLLRSGANIDATLHWRNSGVERHDGYAALHIAADFRNIQLVELLVSKGANVNARNKSGNTPIFVAKSIYRVFPHGSGGPGIHYYYEVPPSLPIETFLRARGGHD